MFDSDYNNATPNLLFASPKPHLEDFIWVGVEWGGVGCVIIVGFLSLMFGSDYNNVTPSLPFVSPKQHLEDFLWLGVGGVWLLL